MAGSAGPAQTARMNTSIRSFLATAALAATALGAAGSASAHDQYAPVPTWQPPRYAYEHDRPGRWDRDGDGRDVCRAPRWDPSARYMPGDTVRRHGELYTATRLSAHVWNVNSPPEWTPRYWVPARC